jgi:UDP-N-acetyl-D-mannosaminuronic acid transferase (WecB/TagA/CpsF family)
MREFYMFGIRFIDGNFSEIFEELSLGGVMTVPAAPALATISEDRHYHEALQRSSFAIFDSGFLCLCLLAFKGVLVKKLSGLEFIRHFLNMSSSLKEGSIFLVDPTPSESVSNRSLFAKHHYTLGNSNQYIAPMYDGKNVVDHDLTKILSTRQPKYILLNLGGGIQEKLAVHLYEHLKFYSPSIICTGAAIAFLTGNQANIPTLLDKLYLGWLSRCISDYKRFVPRYLKGFKLLPMVINENLVKKPFKKLIK